MSLSPRFKSQSTPVAGFNELLYFQSVSEQDNDQGDEFEKIRTIAAVIGAPSERVRVGIGDDAALVAPPKDNLAICTDAFVEGVHFNLSFAKPEEVGHKAVAATLSDLAAVNARPLYLLLSLALKPNLPAHFLNEFYRGARGLAGEFGVDIVGGDLTSSKRDLFIDVVAVGEARDPIFRSGAQPGDRIWVSGTPGLSAAGLQALQKRSRDQISESLLQAHLRPRPRFDLLKNLRANALIDISDGLSSELHHLANASQVRITIDASKVPLHSEAVREAGSREAALQLALSGGEDYELLATSAHDLGEGWTEIGRVETGAPHVLMIDFTGVAQPLVATGFNHFKA